MTEILIKRLSKDVALPKYETEGSSGLDLAANIDKQIKILPGKSEIISTGLAVAIPKNFEIQIRPRSGLAAKSQISVLNTPGTIDADYRGELKVILINLSDKVFVVEKGLRIAQMSSRKSNIKRGYRVRKNRTWLWRIWVYGNLAVNVIKSKRISKI